MTPRPHTKQRRALRKTTATILSVLGFFFGWAILSGVALVGTIGISEKDPATWRFFAELIPFAIMLAFTAAFVRIEQGAVKIPIAENLGRGAAIGTVTGLVWIGTSAAILIATHQLTITGKNDVANLPLWIISAFINVAMQELLIRGYIYQLLKTKYSLLLAVIVTTTIFTLLHGGAFEAGVIPVINVLTMCLFATALYESEKTLVAPIMAHAIWNIIGAIVLGGVSLADDYPSLFSMTTSANTLVSGGDYMMEGSIVVTVINLVLLAFFVYRYKKEPVCRARMRSGHVSKS